MALPPFEGAVRVLALVLGGVFLLQFALYIAADPADPASWHERVTRFARLDPEAWRAGAPEVWQLLTYGLLHAVQDPLHLLGNLLSLWFFGSMLQADMDPRRFALFWFACQLAGGLVFLLPAALGFDSPSAIGASGAAYGVMAACATLHPDARVLLIIVPLRLRTLVLIVLGLTVFSTLLDFKQGSSGVAHLVHLGGLAAGFGLVRSGAWRFDPWTMLARRRAVARIERGAADEERMDRLLEKIHREGIGALTRAEKAFLERMSSRR
jgi:membrane associated rhomboid family serine protease